MAIEKLFTMKYYSTNHQAPDASLEEAVVKGLASDKGLYMPQAIKPLPQEFYDTIENLSFQEIAYRVADAFFGEDVPADVLKQIVYDTLNFDVPVVKVKDNIYSLELFHGPTLAFKDVGGRFMVFWGWKAFMYMYFIRKERSVKYRKSSLPHWGRISLHWKLTAPLMTVRHW